jgi:hypothetical protein
VATRLLEPVGRRADVTMVSVSAVAPTIYGSPKAAPRFIVCWSWLGTLAACDRNDDGRSSAQSGGLT